MATLAAEIRGSMAAIEHLNVHIIELMEWPDTPLRRVRLRRAYEQITVEEAKIDAMRTSMRNLELRRIDLYKINSGISHIAPTFRKTGIPVKHSTQPRHALPRTTKKEPSARRSQGAASLVSRPRPVQLSSKRRRRTELERLLD